MSSLNPVVCPACHAQQDVSVERIGREIRCLNCAASFSATVETPPNAVRGSDDADFADLALALDPLIAAADLVAGSAAVKESIVAPVPTRLAALAPQSRPDDAEESRVRGIGVVVPVVVGFLTFAVVGIAGLGFLAYSLWPESPPPRETAAVTGKQPIEKAPLDKPANPPNANGKKGPAFAPHGPFIPKNADPPAPVPKPAIPAKPKFSFPAVVAAGIKPAPLTADEIEVRLPGKVTDACFGGGGRYWLLLIPDARQIAVFDVNAAKVVKYISVASGNVKFAAGMNKLVVAYPDTGIVSRYDLSTFEKETTVKLPFEGTLKHATMGSASAGPLFVQYAKGGGGMAGFETAVLAFLDLATFKELDPGPGLVNGGAGFARDFTFFFASPDGKMLVSQSLGGGGGGPTVYTLTDSGVKTKSLWDEPGLALLIPADDGTLLGTNGLYTADLKLIGKKDSAFNKTRIPAQQGPAYLALTAIRSPNDFRFDQPAKFRVWVYLIGDDRSLVSLGERQMNMPMVGRILFCPAGNLLGFLSASEDKLVLSKFDLDAEMEKSGVDFLYVASRAPAAEAGKPFKYTVGVKSKKGGVTVKLDSGPPGMKVEGTTVTWDVPQGWNGSDAVLLTVSDASGQEIFHSFNLSLHAPMAANQEPPLVAPRLAVPVDPPVAPPQAATQLVRPPEKPFPIAPTKAADKTEVKLPGSADAVCLAGGGRFVLYRMPKVRQIAVLDVTEGKVKFLPLIEDGALVAGGMSHLYVLAPTANVIQRWSLTTFEKEATIPSPLSGTPRGLLMGHASDGPLFVATPDAFLDARTLKEVKLEALVKGRGRGLGMTWHPSHPPSIRVSADGHVYAWFHRGLSPSGLNSLSIEGNSGKSSSEHTTVGEILPGPDGTLFSAGGIFTPELKPIGARRVYQYWQHPPMPAAHGPFYLSIPQSEVPRSKAAPARLQLHLLGENRTLFAFGELAGLDIPEDNNQTMAKGLQLHDRVALVPDAKAMVVLNGAGTSAFIHRVDVDELLRKSDVDFLYVSSKPPAAVRGSTYSYTPAVRSKKGGVKLKLDAGPDGMKVVGDKVEWAVPAGFADETVSVILTVSDAGAKEMFHTFKLLVKDK